MSWRHRRQAISNYLTDSIMTVLSYATILSLVGHRYRVTIFDRGREVGNPLVSLLLVGSHPHSRKALCCRIRWSMAYKTYTQCVLFYFGNIFSSYLINSINLAISFRVVSIDPVPMWVTLKNMGEIRRYQTMTADNLANQVHNFVDVRVFYNDWINFFMSCMQLEIKQYVRLNEWKYVMFPNPFHVHYIIDNREVKQQRMKVQ